MASAGEQMNAMNGATGLRARGRGFTATALALALGLATIMGALGSQFIGGLVPCELCLEQRVAYYWGLPLLALVLVLWKRLPRTAWYLAMAIAALLFAWSAGLGVYHAGVEWGFWPGPTSCTGTGSAISFDQLGDINAARVVPCDKVQWSLFGVSLAGFNALLATTITALVGFAMLERRGTRD